MRWFFVLIMMFNGVFYLAHKSEQGFDALAEGMIPAPSGGSIQLLAERKGGAVASAPEPQQEQEQQELESPAEDTCLVLGPYPNKADVVRDRAGLSSLKIYLEEFERGADYWVYLGPYSSLGVAIKTGGELRAKQIDNFVIRKGELKDAISLGVFTDGDRAATHAKGLSKKNYDAKIRRIAKRASHFWLVFSGPEGEEAYQHAAELMANSQDDNKKLGKKSCNLIASYQQLD